MTIHQADVLEFPFMATLPKRERTKMGKLWDDFNELRTTMREKGILLPQSVVACLLNVSRSRVCQWVDEGRMDFVRVGDARFVTESSFIEFCKVERKTGRPVALPETFRESVRRAKDHSLRK